MKGKEESENASLKLSIQKSKIMASGPITSWQIIEEIMETVTGFIFLGSKITADGDCSHEVKRHLLLGKRAITNLHSIYKAKKLWQTYTAYKKLRHYFPNKNPYSQSYGFSSSHVWMWELDHKEGWVLKKWCFLTVVLEKTLESPLDCKDIQPVHPKGNQSWILIGSPDAEAEAPVLWTPDRKNCLIRKDPDAGTDWRQEEKGLTEDEIVGWHHQLDRHEFEQAPGDGEG